MRGDRQEPSQRALVDRRQITAEEEALIALLGKGAGGLSASTIGRLKEAWSDEHTRWSKHDLSPNAMGRRLEEAAQCLLVIIGATPEGKKELVGLIDGVRECAQSWKELLLDLKRRGLRWDPSSQSPTAPSASGRRSRRCGQGHAASAVGCTRPPMS